MSELDSEDYKTLMSMFENTPDKVPAPSPDVPPDIPDNYEEELPWN